MSRTFHLRGVPLSAVVDRVTERLRAEGFAPFVEPPVEPGSYRMPDPAVRRLVVLATPDSDWVTLADETFATTAWAERFSTTFERPVLYMAGECDHAFFTHAVVYENGAEIARAEVPRDVVLDDDGRHRIRPVCLARIAPEAKAMLEAGVVVHELGGEQNVVAIGKALGIVDAMPDPYYLPDGATLLTFRFEKRPDAVDYLPSERDPLGLGSMLGDDGLAMLEGLPAGEAGMAAILGSVMKGFVASLGEDGGDGGGWEICDVREVREPEGPVRLDLHPRNGRIGVPEGIGFSGSIALREEHEAPLRGFEIELSGDALALFEIDRLAIEPLDGSAPSIAEGVTTSDGARRFAFPDAVLRHPEAEPSDDDGVARNLPLGEALRQSINDRFGMLTRFQRSMEAGFRMHASGTPTRAGSGSVTVRVITSAGTTEAEPFTLEALEPLRLPQLPSWVEENHWRHEHDVTEYRGKDHVVGWLGFQGPWSDVAALATRIATRMASVVTDITGATFAAHADLDDGALTFKDVPWKKLLPALARAAEVELHAGERYGGGASILVGHRPRGFVGSGDLGEDHVRELDLVPVYVAWSIPTPPSREARAKLTEALEEALIEAGAVSASVGGFAGTQGQPLMRVGDPPYVSMAGTRGLGWKTRWLTSHVRTPAWLVLAPPAAAAKLAKTKAPRIETKKLAHATLIRSTAADPFVYEPDDADAMESFVMPAIGSADEIPKE